MAVSVRNLTKFLENHPELTHLHIPILAIAQKRSHRGIISDFDTRFILQDLAPVFLGEIKDDPSHQKIKEEDIQKL